MPESAATPSDLERFLARTRDLLAAERAADAERGALLLSSCSPRELERAGLALGGLSVASLSIGLGGKTLVELERAAAYHSSNVFPPHTFRPGDLARVEENVSAAPRKGTKKEAVTEGVEGVVYKVSDTRLVIAVDPSGPGKDEVELPERCRALKLANSVTYDRIDKTVDQLERLALPPGNAASPVPARTRLLEVLMGLSTLSPPMHVDELAFFDNSLNDSQRTAIRFALSAPEVACIHGPPGTGKTHTLVELIRQICKLDDKARVLVCGASNLAADNVLERLLARAPELSATRIGHPARVLANSRVLDSTLDARAERSEQAELAKDVKRELDELVGTLNAKGGKGKTMRPRGDARRKMWDEVRNLRKEYRQREGRVVKSVLSTSRVVVATCHSAGSRSLQGQDFDVVIIDEATQALEAVCWIPILKAKKLVLAGDPMQLPPTVLSDGKIKKEKKAVKPRTRSKETSKKESSNRERSQNAFSETPPSTSVTQEAAADNNDVVSEPLSSDQEAGGGDNQLTTVHDTATLAAKRAQTAPAKFGKLRPPRTLETTLFDRLERMYGPRIKRVLTVQYRMNDTIQAFPSAILYKSLLKADTSVAKRLLQDLPNIAAHLDTHPDADEDGVLSTPIVFYDTSGCEFFERAEDAGLDDAGSKCNENEAGVVVRWIETLIKAGVSPSQIAVVTPYQAQVTLITSLVRPVFGTELEVGTADGMQGREREAVVISLVRSNQNREVGFLDEKRRLNVAMTRAKCSLCVVGDSGTLKHGSPYLKDWMEWLEANADVRYAGPD